MHSLLLIEGMRNTLMSELKTLKTLHILNLFFQKPQAQMYSIF